jgi:hypothetical protein
VKPWRVLNQSQGETRSGGSDAEGTKQHGLAELAPIVLLRPGGSP